MCRLSIGLLACGVTVLLNLTSAHAPNYFAGGDFEAPVMSHVGDTVTQMPAPWVASTQYSTSTQASTFHPLSIVRVEGSNGTIPTADPAMPGGDPLLQALPRSDASNTPTGQYARSVSAVGWGTRFGQRVELPSDGCMKFSGKFSASDTAPTALGLAIIGQTPSYLATLQNNPPLNAFGPYMGQNSQTGLVDEFFPIDTGAVWQGYAVRLQVTANTTYTFAFMISGGVAVDDLVAEYVAREQCDPNWTPPTFDPAATTLEKTCDAPVSATHNGELGQMWDCQVRVTVPEAPFSGTLVVTDVFAPTSTTASDIVSATSVSGNFDCVSGATCSIAGSDFDVSGTEILDYSIFVSATDLQNDYPMQNCVHGAYDDGAGGISPVSGNCVSAQWIPRTSITKTCDPLVAVTSGPMTLNCQLEVTGTDLTTDSIVMAGDALAALPPMTATISGSMMNVTSNEPWSCTDATLNAPGSIGLCELSAVDMFAAGGTSTINVSLQFTPDQNSGQVANCPMTDILPASYIDTFGMRSSQPPMRSPQSNASAGLPDNCVILDLPQSEVTPKLERVELEKFCDTPELATVQGALGYTWECRAEITVTPTPFAGTFTFDDDASNISIGSAQFVSVSEPNCMGLTTDHLQCQLDGTTMTAPHVVTYQLFTEVVDPNQPIEWKNCVEGTAVTTAGVYPSDTHCVDTVIKPDVPTDPDAKEITVEKFCGRAFEEENDGAQGIGWDCEITVTAVPAPFSGVFTFTEDATAVSGSGNAAIVDIVQQGNDWTCTPAVPTSLTECTIAGSDFDASGVETVSFHLFAETGDGPVEWRNCVSGVYTAISGKPRDVKDNCQGITWKPDTTPTFSLKKGCRLAGVENENALYACSIYITQTGGSPISAPLTFDELFSTTSGTSASQYILNLLGTPAMPNGWDCDQPPYANGASCTISAANFNGNTGHRIDAFLSIPTAVLGKDDFQICAQVRVGDQVVGAAECVPFEESDQATTFDVEKTCKANGARTILGTNIWVQPYQCTLVVTTNGVPFTGPLWIMEDLHFGQNPGNASIQNITSADPWDCASPPYGPAGQGNAPYCGIHGPQFPASGSSSLTVDMMMNGAMDTYGAENCVEISVGALTATGLPAAIASDCFEIAPEPKPTLNLTKVCAPAVLGGGDLWTVECTVTISGTNLPSGHQIDLRDGLQGSGSTIINSGVFNPSSSSPQNCTAYVISSGLGSQCTLTSDQITANGGSISLPYTGTLTGNRFGLNSPPATNCATATISSLNLTAPQNLAGQACVEIPLELHAVPGGSVATGGIAVGPFVGGEAASCSKDVLFIIDKSKWMDASHGNRIDYVKTAIIRALDGFRGNGSEAAIRAVSTGSGYFAGFQDIDTSYPGLVAATIPLISATGEGNWQSAFSGIGPRTPAPLILFITAGPPTYRQYQNTAASQPASITAAVNAALPRVMALRAQGSRIIGIGIGTDIDQAHLTTILGSNTTSYPAGGAVDPFVNDVIMIPNPHDAPTVFAQIAAAYCPTPQTPSSASTVVNELSAEEPRETATPIVPTPAPSLAVIKEQSGPCVVNRASQTYDCGFRLSVTNTGTEPYIGPLVMTDTAGNPGIKSATGVWGNGWSCGAAVRDAVSCTNPAVNLTPGGATHVDLRMKVKGLRKGGSIQNCGIAGVTDDRSQRVALIQKIMNDRGLKAGPVDGDPGRKTFAALAKLRSDLGLPISREFDDALFEALGLPLQSAGAESCVVAQLPPMPAPPLQCNLTTTVKSGESCLCRFDNMDRRNATSCQCGGGFQLIKGKGCVAEAVPTPEPVPNTSPLSCEKASTRLSGDQCVCLDQKNAKKVSPTQCRCSTGLPMIGGKCLAIEITPAMPRTDTPAPSDDIDTPAKCRIKLNGLCIK